MLLGNLREGRERLKREVGKGKGMFVAAVSGWKDLSQELGMCVWGGWGTETQMGEMMGHFERNEEKELVCSLMEGDGPELTKWGLGFAPNLCLWTEVSGLANKEPRPEEMPLFKLRKLLGSQ